MPFLGGWAVLVLSFPALTHGTRLAKTEEATTQQSTTPTRIQTFETPVPSGDRLFGDEVKAWLGSKEDTVAQQFEGCHTVDRLRFGTVLGTGEDVTEFAECPDCNEDFWPSLHRYYLPSETYQETSETHQEITDSKRSWLLKGCINMSQIESSFCTVIRSIKPELQQECVKCEVSDNPDGLQSQERCTKRLRFTNELPKLFVLDRAMPTGTVVSAASWSTLPQRDLDFHLQDSWFPNCAFARRLRIGTVLNLGSDVHLWECARCAEGYKETPRDVRQSIRERYRMDYSVRDEADHSIQVQGCVWQPCGEGCATCKARSVLSLKRTLACEDCEPHGSSQIVPSKLKVTDMDGTESIVSGVCLPNIDSIDSSLTARDAISLVLAWLSRDGVEASLAELRPLQWLQFVDHYAQVMGQEAREAARGDHVGADDGAKHMEADLNMALNAMKVHSRQNGNATRFESFQRPLQSSMFADVRGALVLCSAWSNGKTDEFLDNDDLFYKLIFMGARCMASVTPLDSLLHHFFPQDPPAHFHYQGLEDASRLALSILQMYANSFGISYLLEN